MDGFALAFQWLFANPFAFVVIFGGLAAGIVLGAMPGLTGSAGIAIAIPLTFVMDPISAILMLTGIYIGSVFGGSITAILFNTPASPEAACTTLDGYPMAKRGEGGKALGAAVGASAFGGAVSVLFLALMAPPLARVALTFGAAEYFALAFIGISVISSLEAKSYWKSLCVGLMGLMLAIVGLDPLSAATRFTFGVSGLIAGFHFMPVIIGMFAIGEILTRAESRGLGVFEFGGEISKMKVSVQLPSLKEWLGVRWSLFRGILVGLIIGILPGVGATTAAFVAYSEEVRWSKDPKKYGTGVMEGIVAPESSTNVAACGSMIPLLALGIPGSASTAVMIGGLMIHGIRPGPLMMVQQREMVYAIFVTMFLANVATLVLGVFAVRFFAAALKVHYTILAPIIAVLCVIGVFSLNNSTFEVTMLIYFGILGYFFKKYDFPVAPLIIGMVLGSLAETNLRRALALTQGDVFATFTRPITAFLMLLGIASLAYGFYKNLIKKPS